MAGGPSPTLANMDLFSDIDLQSLLGADFEAQQHHLQQQYLHQHNGVAQAVSLQLSPSLPAMPTIGAFYDSAQPPLPQHPQHSQHQHQHPHQGRLQGPDLQHGATAAAHPSLPDFGGGSAYLQHSGSSSFGMQSPRRPDEQLMKRCRSQAGEASGGPQHADQAHAMQLPLPASALHHSSSAGALPHVSLHSSW